jgi:chemosensory pili system protein ChpA (sensor histidine kinase/response regulator)
MTESLDNTVFATLIKEIKNLLSEIKGLLPLLTDKKSDKKEITTKLHSLTTTIMGVASMMNLDELTNTVTLVNKILNDIIQAKLVWSPQLQDVMTETSACINRYCSSLEAKEDIDDKLFQNAVTAFSEFIDTSADDVDKPDCKKKKIREDIFDQLSQDDFFEDVEDDIDIDLDFFEEDDKSPVMPLEISSSEINESGITESEITEPEMTNIDPEFIESFNAESKDHLDNIGKQLNLLASFIKKKTDIFDGYREILHSIRRSVHTLKGAAAVIGLESIGIFGNVFEDFLDWLHDESDNLSPKIIEAMLDSADILEKLAVNPDIKINNKIEDIKNKFKDLMSDFYNAASVKEKKSELESINKSGDQPVDQTMVEQIKISNSISVNYQALDDFGMTDIDPEFLESFNEESKDHLNNINQQLNLLSSSVNKRVGISDGYRMMLHSIRRSVHTLKGAAAVIGLKPVASYGDEFENFLDWLHDDSDIISPDIITAMLDGTDILEKISTNPTIKIDNEIGEIKNIFKDIMAISSDALLEKEEEAELKNIDEQILQPINLQTHQPVNQIVEKPLDQPKIKQVKISKTLRVDMEKVDQMIGLIGDMTINLSSHENSSQFFQTTLFEFDTTMKRLKDITLNLETGFELAEIPHLSSVTGSVHKENQSIDINEFDPLEMDRYSDLHIMIRSLNEAVADLNSIMDQTLKVQNLWQSTMSKQRRVIAEIQSSMQKIKMTPFSTLSNRLHKTVRESARITGKPVQLIIEGDSMEMDTLVWDVLADPLMHLLRNAVDHGIESPDERKRSKKPKQATIRIKCIRQGSRLNMSFSDDGKGLDYDQIKKRALKLYPKKNVSTMDNDELTALIFKQGFTIKTKTSALSGRGVGMDVVNFAVKQLNGSIEIKSTAGKGTEFIIRLPIEVAQLPALLVKFGQQKFAVPLHDITRVFRIKHKQSRKNDFQLDNTLLPLLRPAEIFGLPPTLQPYDDNPFVLSVDVGTKKGILVTDSIIGRKDVVFKNLGPHLHNIVPCIAGATIMGDGSLIPIINTEELFLRRKLSAGPNKKPGLKISRASKKLNILIVDDSISIRKVLANFVNNQGWHPSVAKDGVDAIEMIRRHPFHLILLDIEMPRMNGFDVLQSLQLHSEYSEIPVLMLTSRSAKKYKDKATELGARGFVTKPFKDDELLSLIKGHLEPDLLTQKVNTGK